MLRANSKTSIIFTVALLFVIITFWVFSGRDIKDPDRDIKVSDRDITADQNCKDENEPWRLIFGNYVRSYPDLLAAYNKSKAKNSRRIEDWGRKHYDNFGMHEGRNLFKSIPNNIKELVDHGEVELYHLTNSVCRLIDIWDPSDVYRLRTKLITFIWGNSNLPKRLPKTVTENYKGDKRFNDLENLLRIDNISISMEFGMRSRAFHFFPKNGNNTVILVHQGHGGDFSKSKNVIEEFLIKGYSVVGFSMPLLGQNNEPIAYLPKFGYRKLDSHDYLKFLTPNDGHPIQYFFEPVLQVVNYLEKYYDYKLLSMTGLSGGGWTTTVVSALDERISLSFPVAGSAPIFLRDNDDFGDWEQTVPEFYRLANYPELYVLGAHGYGRKQLWIFNFFDNCCFGGPKMLLFWDSVRSRVTKLGSGEFDLFVDQTTKKHTISDAAIALIDQNIKVRLDKVIKRQAIASE